MSGDLSPISWTHKLTQGPEAWRVWDETQWLSVGWPVDKASIRLTFLSSHPPEFYLISRRHTPLSCSLQTEELWGFLSFCTSLRKTSPHTNTQIFNKTNGADKVGIAPPPLLSAHTTPTGSGRPNQPGGSGCPNKMDSCGKFCSCPLSLVILV